MWDRRYYVYIIANATRILYTGITNNLVRRVWEHKTKQTDGFTSHFHVCRLVYYESFDDAAQGDRSREADQALASRKEDLAD